MTDTVVAVRPQAGSPREYHFPTFQRVTLDNGIKLIVAPVKKLPLATVLVLVEAGAVTEPTGKEGIAQLTAKALTEGTARHDGEALTTALEQLGTSIEAAADWDISTVELTVLIDKLPQAFDLLADVLTAPAFPTAAIERLKGERIAEILQTESDPGALADERFEAFAYAEGSRYRVPVGGSKASVSALTPADVQVFYQARFCPGAMTIIVAGDVTLEGMEQLANSRLRGWTGEVPASVTTTDAPARETRAVEIIRKTDAPQSELRIGQIGVPRTHPEYFAITVMNAVLGGLFSSRINLNLREAHGYTYGAHSKFDWRRGAGPFVISTAVESNVTAPAITETLREIERMRSEEISESELSLATSYLDGIFPIRFETTLAIATALAALVTFGLPEDWYDTYRSRVRAVTTGDVLTAMQRYIDPAKLQIVIVGDPNAIREPIEALQFGPVTVATE